MRNVALLVFALFAACAGPAVRVRAAVGPDGSPGWWSIACPDEIGACVANAKERCPDGYREAGQIGAHAEGPPTASASIPIEHTQKKQTLTGEMLIRCTSAGP